MADKTIVKDSTDVTIYIWVYSTSANNETGLTGLVYNTASLTCYYVRPLAAAAALSLATQTVTGAHSDGGFVEIDSTNMPGLYRLDLSDAICATGVDDVTIMLRGAANMADSRYHIRLTGFDLDSVKITDILNVVPLIPTSIDVADTKTWRLGLMLLNSLDDLPTTGEITPGTISIDLAAPGETTWTSIVSDAACSELAGMIYYDEVFDSGTGYSDRCSIRVTFKSQSIAVGGNTYEISDANGRIFYTEIRESKAPLTAAQTNAEVDTALTDIGLDHLLSAAVIGTDVTDNSIIAYLASKSATADWDSFVNTTDALEAIRDNQGTAQTGDTYADWADGGRLDLILDAIVADTNELQVDDVPGLIAALNDLSAAAVNTEVDTALTDIGLDHLVSAAVIGTDITDNSIIAYLASKSATADWDSFVNTTDALEAIRDNQAAASPTAAAIADAVWDEPKADHTGSTTFGDLATDLDLALADTAELQTDWVDGGRLDLIIDAILVDSNSLNDTKIPDTISLAAINAEVDTALATTTYAEAAAVPAATASLKDKLVFLATLARNKITETSSTQTLYADDGVTSVGTSTVSDDGTTTTRGEYT